MDSVLNPALEVEPTFFQCLKHRQVWIIWAMSTFSVMIGIITVSVIKTFAFTRPNLNNEKYITEVISISCVFNSLRALWSIFLDHSTYKKVYGSLLILETTLGFTYCFSSKSKYSYAIWIWLNQWCEGGHFTLIPNILNIMYGKYATQIYGCIFSFNSISSLILLFVLRTSMATKYFYLWGLGSCMSCISIVILFTLFKQEKFMVKPNKVEETETAAAEAEEKAEN